MELFQGTGPLISVPDFTRNFLIKVTKILKRWIWLARSFLVSFGGLVKFPTKLIH